VAAVADGVAACAIDARCREVIRDAGWGDLFVHGTGHGVGLDIHEAPAVSSRSADTLYESAVITVEPGVYIAGKCGARIEDTVVVTREGCRVLTRAHKELVVS
jgi:Xaa-Pro aminopeptidase